MTTLLIPFAAQSLAAGKAFVPVDVFAGRSEGKGEMRLLLGKKRAFTVESLGIPQTDGRLRLEQSVRFEGKPVQSRTWVMWQTEPGHYSATLTGAAGPVVGRTEGSRLTLRYPLKRWGLVMHQTLDLSGDGRTLANCGSIRFLGIPVGKLRETIQLAR
ncbi:MAG: DUF3833 family protein [Thermoanaerobaculia bacterium]